nr:hypothetical protein [Deltaproteobacteria bacterium]
MNEYWVKIYPSGRFLQDLVMRFAVHQPTFLPWPGLIYKAMQVDTLVLLDQVQYPRGFSWMNRNRLKCMTGSVWFTIPVIKKGQGLQPIDRVRVLNANGWRRKHLMTLEHCYKNAPFFQEHFAFFEQLYTRAPEKLLYWNMACIDYIFRSIDLHSSYLLQSEIGINKAKGTGLLVAVAEKLGANKLVAPRAGKGRIDISLLKDAGITVQWLDYHSPVYPQLWGEFIKDLSAMDLLFNCGPYSRRVLERAQR